MGKSLGTLLRFGFLAAIKITARLLYRFQIEWVAEPAYAKFQGIRLGLLLNHTSLFEPLYLGAMPFGLLWQISKYGVFPGADVTLNRPLLGRFFRLMARDVVTITRKRDASWELFLERMDSHSIVMIAPEGRMKRPGGLDKDGKPMTVRGGVADILEKLPSGQMLIVYSGGLHHVHTPGDRWPRIFKTLSGRFEQLDIATYKTQIGKLDTKDFRAAVIQDLEARRDRNCPN